MFVARNKQIIVWRQCSFAESVNERVPSYRDIQCTTQARKVLVRLEDEFARSLVLRGVQEKRECSEEAVPAGVRHLTDYSQ